jgi:hypothetical protein
VALCVARRGIVIDRVSNGSYLLCLVWLFEWQGWGSGGFGYGLCHGKTCSKERESSKKSNQVGTTGVVGLSCTLGSLIVPVERRGDDQGDGLIVPTLGGVAGDAGSEHAFGGTLGGAAWITWVVGSAL